MRLSLQIALLCASVALVGAQIPRRAFGFRARPAPRSVPGAALLELDEATFTLLRRRVLASSLQAASSWNEGATDREIGAFALEETLPPPALLAVDEGYQRAELSFGGDVAPARVPIKPASLAAGALDGLPPPASEPRRPQSDLLDLGAYQSLDL